jgi:hypothetical protein
MEMMQAPERWEMMSLKERLEWLADCMGLPQLDSPSGRPHWFCGEEPELSDDRDQLKRIERWLTTYPSLRSVCLAPSASPTSQHYLLWCALRSIAYSRDRQFTDADPVNLLLLAVRHYREIVNNRRASQSTGNGLARRRQG